MASPIYVQLACKHYVTIRSMPNAFYDEQNCKYDGWQPIVTVHRAVWHSICRQPDCDYRRTHGMSRRYANEGAEKHHLRTGHPVVVQFYNPNKLPKDTEIQGLTDIPPPTLFDPNEPIPF